MVQIWKIAGLKHRSEVALRKHLQKQLRTIEDKTKQAISHGEPTVKDSDKFLTT